eukprot:1942829-Rhodomonas_salina.2
MAKVSPTAKSIPNRPFYGCWVHPLFILSLSPVQLTFRIPAAIDVELVRTCVTASSACTEELLTAMVVGTALHVRDLQRRHAKLSKAKESSSAADESLRC